MTKEPLSIVIACYNGEGRLPGLLESIRRQEYDQGKIEIIVVDDDSTDGTVDVAARFGARVVRNGSRNIERGKSIGFASSTHEYVMFIDDDNRLPHERWLASAVQAMSENPDATGVQAAYFCVLPSDPAINRYCSIFGVSDPLGLYLHRKDHLASYDDRWTLRGDVVAESPTYWKVAFSPSTFPTIGSQGFIGRRSLIERTNWRPHLFHIDGNYELMLAGKNRFLFLKDAVQHDYCDSIASLLRKKRRDLRLFLEQSASRQFRWQTGTAELIGATVTMAAVIEPFARSIYAYMKTRDPACFLHPAVSVIFPAVYAYDMAAYRLRRKLS